MLLLNMIVVMVTENLHFPVQYLFQLDLFIVIFSGFLEQNAEKLDVCSPGAI